MCLDRAGARFILWLMPLCKKEDKMARRNKSLILSFKAMRRLIGILGMALPLVCWLGGLVFGDPALGGEGLQRSISRYYYTNVRDFFVGLMLGMAFFMMTYKGHEPIDTLANIATGLAGICVGLFPCLATDASARVGFFQLREGASNVVHLACAGTFFVLLALTSLFLFTRTHEDRVPTGRKKKRNVIYIACGCVMLAALAALLVFPLVLDDQALDRTRLVFIAETVLLEAFGVSWLVKGETILRDRRAAS
jgi:hypothetical protein